MNTPPPANESPAGLLADHAWARRLARQLVRDAALADDVVQEACARALAHPPAREPRAWLGGIVRNLAREFRRERVRRERREAQAARPEAQPSAADALERLSAQQDVVRAVLALEEPYRSTIVLRFYDELPPRKIAAREGVPVATVKTRLARGLALLRGALDREHGGDGRAWALALLPLAEHGPRFGPLAGPALMQTLAKLALVASAVVFVVWLARREPGASAIGGEAVAAPAALAELVTGPPHEFAPAPTVRESALTPESPAPPTSELSTAAAIHGRVLDVTGAPVAGVALNLRYANGSRTDPEEIGQMSGSTFGSLLWAEALKEDALAWSGPDGTFELVPPSESYGSVVSCDPSWESVLVPDFRADEQTLVVAPRIRLAGVVHDAAGAPLAGVELRFGVPRERLSASGTNLAETQLPDWSAKSDAAGRFELARLPAVPGAILRARLAPYESRRVAREAWSDDELVLVLERASGPWLEGLVVAAGTPVAGATVALGPFATQTDSAGAFQIRLEGRTHEAELCALAAGFRPTRVAGDRDADGSVRWPDSVRIELAGAPLALAGVVVDAEGEPLAGQEVWLGEGRTVLRDEFPFLLESVLAGKHEARLGTKSDAQGHFELAGLEEREYQLLVVDPNTALSSTAGPFAAGHADLRLVQPTERVWTVVRGVVVSGSGEPVAGLRVCVTRDVDSVQAGPASYFGFNAYGARTETDELGAFELHEVPRDGMVLNASAIDIVDPELALEADLDPLELRVVVARWVRLEVHVGPAYPGATGFSLVDASGAGLPMEVAMNGGTAHPWQQALVEGRSPVVKVDDRAAFVVLRGAAGELARQALTLHAGVVNRVDF